MSVVILTLCCKENKIQYRFTRIEYYNNYNKLTSYKNFDYDLDGKIIKMSTYNNINKLQFYEIIKYEDINKKKIIVYDKNNNIKSTKVFNYNKYGKNYNMIVADSSSDENKEINKEN